MDFVLNGESRSLNVEQVRSPLSSVEPEPVREYGVRIDGTVYPVKQAFGVATEIPRRDFTSQTAARHLARLSFNVVAGAAVSWDHVPRGGQRRVSRRPRSMLMPGPGKAPSRTGFSRLCVPTVGR